jgi:tetratricopeptide (TPR) repeat protein
MCSKFWFLVAALAGAGRVNATTSDTTFPDPPHIAEWRKSIADSGPLYEAGRFDDAALVLEKAVRYAERFAPLDPRLPTTVHALAFLYQQQGKSAEAGHFYLWAIDLWKRIGSSQRDALLLSIDNLIGTYMEAQKFSAAKKLMESRLPDMEQSAKNWEARATLLNMRASLAKMEHRYGEAERLFRESLSLWEEQGPAGDKNIAIVLLNLSHLFAEAKHYQNALDMVRRALLILERLDATARPLVILAQDHAGGLCVKLKRPVEAEAFYRDALAMAKGAYGPENRVSGDIMLRYSAVLHALRQNNEARVMAKEAQTLLRRSNEKRTVDIHELAISGR